MQKRKYPRMSALLPYTDSSSTQTALFLGCLLTTAEGPPLTGSSTHPA